MKKILIIFFSFFLLITMSCKEEYTPKPRGYYRISFQEKAYYQLYSATFPYRFDIPEYSRIVPDDERNAEPFWVNLQIPAHKAELHISYKKVDNNLAKLTEDSRSLAYKHSQKADAIDERIFINDFACLFVDDGQFSPVDLHGFIVAALSLPKGQMTGITIGVDFSVFSVPYSLPIGSQDPLSG